MLARHKDAVYRQIARVCGNYDDTEDVLVQALLAAYRSLDQVRDDDALRAWLATIGRRICRRMKSKDALAPILGLQAAEQLFSQEDPTDELEQRQIKSCVQDAIESLPEGYRNVYEMRELQGMTGEEVASHLGLTLANVKSRLHRARKMVREHLDRSVCAM